MASGGELRRSAPAVRAALALVATACAGCIASYQTVPWVDTQRHPEPMGAPDDLPPGVSERWQAGPEVVQVVRHSDPVYVVRPGVDSSYPLSFWNKGARVTSGSGVRVEAGGRAEIAWDHGTRLMLFGPATGVLGAHSRGEPAFVFAELGRAVLYPSQVEELWLVGGARLSALAGPIVVDHERDEVLRVQNQSGSLLVLRYRDELIELDPGQLVDLALLRESTAPFASTLGWRALQGAGFPARVAGEGELSEAPGAVRVRASEPLELEGLGVRVALPAGESAVLSRPGAAVPPELIEPTERADPTEPASSGVEPAPRDERLEGDETQPAAEAGEEQR